MSVKKERLYFTVKRGLDVVFSIAALIALMPLMLVIALVVKAESRGPLLFRHERVGRHGRSIRILKFRTMILGAEELDVVLTEWQREEFYKEFKLPEDPRVTRVGRFLRRWGMDEIPQLINVLRGEMSLVGPRPVTAPEYANYTTEEAVLVQSMRPGLMGYWQAYGRNRAKYETGERQRMELFYVRNASFLLDIKVVGKTMTLESVWRKEQ